MRARRLWYSTNCSRSPRWNPTNNRTADVPTVLPITTRREGRDIYPNEALLAAEEGGLPAESIILAHQIRTVSKQRLKKVLGYITNDETRSAVHNAITNHLELHWDA